jgi:superfamily II DNA/RNA helicase
MQPFGAVEKIKESYQRFVETSFPIKDPILQAEFQRLIRDEHLLWQEPYVSLSRPYLPGGTLQQLVDEGYLDKKITTVPFFKAARPTQASLYHHQYKAIQRLSTSPGHEARNTIIATGTGSGKTEAFLIPIINHCLLHPEPGTQAVIVYPMNALANDQLSRLRLLLRGTGVSFGRYTGDTESKRIDTNEKIPAEERYDREQMQHDPPQILLTNYTMLEYLLVRQKDREMFLKTTPRFLVLDEVHTYVGILGTEVACLIRRFKEHARIPAGQLCCIGTSATLKSGTASLDTNPYASLITFAESLFGEAFDHWDQSIIDEQYQKLPDIPDDFPLWETPHISEDFFTSFNSDDEDQVRALAACFRIYFAQGACGDRFFTALYDELSKCPIFTKFEALLEKPKSITVLVDWLRKRKERAHASDEALKREAAAILLLGSIAYRVNPASGEKEPRYRPKVHLSVRSLTPLTMALQLKNGVGKLFTAGETEYAPPDQENGAAQAHNGSSPAGRKQAALPLAVCRTCGAHYLKGYYEYDEEMIAATAAASPRRKTNGRAKSGRATKKNKKQLPDLLTISANQPYKKTFQEIYVHLLPVDHKKLEELHSEDDVPEGEDTETVQEGQRTYLVCPYCLVAHASDTLEDPALFLHKDPECPGQHIDLPRFLGFGKAVQCPVCNAKGSGLREVITLMRSGAATSVSILTESLLPQIKEKDEKRLLIFADSRQDTAHQAGYLRDRHQTFAQRQLTYKTIEQYERREKMPVPLDELNMRVYNYSKNTWDSEAEALNLLALDRYRPGDLDIGLKSSDANISGQERRKAQKRLEWDLYIEFTERANTRNSLEREGLVAVNYSNLEQSAREHISRFATFGITNSDADIQFLTTALRVIMDYMRRQRAVDYDPFHDYLSGGSDFVLDGTARPNKFNRTPAGFDAEKKKVQGAYNIYNWYNKANPESYRTAIYDAIARMFEGTLEAEAITAFIDQAVALLKLKGYIREVRIGQQTGGNASLKTKAYQLVPTNIELTVQGERFRCQTCGDVRGYQVKRWSKHHHHGSAICANYRCHGTTVAYPVRDQNFYVKFYRESQPERLYAVEHSGQISGEARENIEEAFRDHKINALVCTQTLELGVDIGDLPAIILRNIPPTPSNYAQRSGRPGRKHRIALILSHAGQGPHDTYYYHRLDEMIAGAIRPPIFLLDNEVVIRRHINSLILEKLVTAELPSRWQEPEEKQGTAQKKVDDDATTAIPQWIVSEDGELHRERLDALMAVFKAEIAQRRPEIVQSVKRAFVQQDRSSSTSLSWLNTSYIERQCDLFVEGPQGLRQSLEHWCDRYEEIYTELVRMNRKVLLSATEERRRNTLLKGLRTLLGNREYRPLSYLSKMGFLPRYGFAGNTVTVHDDKEQQISQVASVGITEYAPGNIVYVAGNKLKVNRVHFKGGAKVNPLDHAQSYKYCPTCTYMTQQTTAQECPYCHQFLVSRQMIEYEMAHGWSNESITQEDEYRSHQDYDLQIYLAPEEYASENVPPPQTKQLGQWPIRYTRLRRITLFNRGKVDPKTGMIIPFNICLECGAWIKPRSMNVEEAERLGFRPVGTDHLYTCSARTDSESPFIQHVDLEAHLEGDVVEIDIPYEISTGPNFDSWVETLQQSFKLGLQLELFIKPGEIESFVATRTEGGKERKTLVLYDTMPGGTGYLQRFYRYLPHIARRVRDYLSEQTCETACYSCLKEFWNQRIHALLDRKLVEEVLGELADAEEE